MPNRMKTGRHSSRSRWTVHWCHAHPSTGRLSKAGTGVYVRRLRSRAVSHDNPWPTSAITDSPISCENNRFRSNTLPPSLPASVEHLTATNFIAGTKAKPGRKGFGTTPFAHVNADLRDNEQHTQDIEPDDLSQVHSADAP